MSLLCFWCRFPFASLTSFRMLHGASFWWTKTGSKCFRTEERRKNKGCRKNGVPSPPPKKKNKNKNKQTTTTKNNKQTTKNYCCLLYWLCKSKQALISEDSMIERPLKQKNSVTSRHNRAKNIACFSFNVYRISQSSPMTRSPNILWWWLRMLLLFVSDRVVQYGMKHFRHLPIHSILAWLIFKLCGSQFMVSGPAL